MTIWWIYLLVIIRGHWENQDVVSLNGKSTVLHVYALRVLVYVEQDIFVIGYVIQNIFFAANLISGLLTTTEAIPVEFLTFEYI